MVSAIVNNIVELALKKASKNNAANLKKIKESSDKSSATEYINDLVELCFLNKYEDPTVEREGTSKINPPGRFCKILIKTTEALNQFTMNDFN